jgi:hypothetical protein
VTSLRKEVPVLPMPKGTLMRVDDVLEVDEDALGGLGAHVGDVVLAGGGADEGLEHQVELAGFGEMAGFAGKGRRNPRVMGLQNRQRNTDEESEECPLRRIQIDPKSWIARI